MSGGDRWLWLVALLLCVAAGAAAQEQGAPAALDASACLEWSAAPYESQGMLMVPLGEAFAWFGCPGSAEGARWETSGTRVKVRMTLKGGQTQAAVNDELVTLPQPMQKRGDRHFVPLRWVAGVCGGSLEGDRIPGALVVHTPDGVRLLPRTLLPYQRIGLACWVHSLRGRAPGAGQIAARLRSSLRAKLAAQGITLVEKPSVSAAVAAGLPATLVAEYFEEYGGEYQQSHHEGTDVTLTLRLRDERGGDTGWSQSVYGESPWSVLVGSLSEVRSTARREAISSLWSELANWQPAPPDSRLWWQRWGAMLAGGSPSQ